MKRKMYMIQFNMAGLHDCVYELKPRGWLKEWYDPTGDISADINKPFNVRDGVTQILFKRKAEARKALTILKLYRDHVKRHM